MEELITDHGYWEYNVCYGFGAVPGPCCEIGCGRPMEEHEKWNHGGFSSWIHEKE